MRSGGQQVTACPSLGVGLIFRARFIERRKLQTCGVHCDDLRKFIERHLQPVCICDLRHKTYPQRSHAHRKLGSRGEQGFQRSKAHDDPVMVPRVDLGCSCLS